jgi:hypothetical protein
MNKAQHFMATLDYLPARTDYSKLPLIWFTGKDRLLCARCATEEMRNDGGYGWDYPVDCFVNTEDGGHCEECARPFDKA